MINKIKNNIVVVAVILLLLLLNLAQFVAQPDDKSKELESLNKKYEKVVKNDKERIQTCVKVMDSSIEANAYYLLSDMALRNAMIKYLNGDTSTVDADVESANDQKINAEEATDKYSLYDVKFCRDGK